MITNPAPVVVSVGWLGERKGHQVLIKAMRQVHQDVPEVRCIIVGEGPLRKMLSRQIVEAELSGVVTLLGALPHPEVIRLLHEECTVFALPSWDEPLGVAYLEAMAAGKPVIGTCGEGISEIIQDGREGFLIQPRDANGIARAIITLIRNKDLCTRMGRAAFQTAQQFTWEANAQRLRQVFQLISRGR